MSKPTMVLLHGVGLDHTAWDEVSALLADDFEVVAPDLPGHGTNPPAPEGTTLSDLADGVLDEVPPGSHLVGFSLGALVAQYLAVHRPGLAATLTSVSSVCRRTPAEREAVLQRLSVAESDFSASATASLRRWYDDTDVVPQAVERTRETLLGNDPSSFVNCYRVFATGDAEVGPVLDRITIPALAITGELDPGSTPEMSRRLAEAIPSCRVVIVPGARHMLPVERPRELVSALTTFIEEEDTHV